jgi:hypothetical protein
MTTTPRAIAPTTGNMPTIPRYTTIGKLLADRVAVHKPVDPVVRQQAIENALSMALHLVRTNDTTEALQRATGRAIRAASMMKQACTEAAMIGRA